MKTVIFANISESALAEILGVGDFKIRDWVAQGLPRNLDGTFTLCKAIRWIMTQHKEAERRKIELTRISQRDLVKLVGKSRIQVLNWSKYHGCPRNDDASYNLADVICWFPKYYEKISRQRFTKAARLIGQLSKIFKEK